MTRDVPNRILGLRRSHEYAVEFCDAGMTRHKHRIPPLDPIRLSHRTQQRKDARRITQKALRISMCNTVWCNNLHDVLLELRRLQGYLMCRMTKVLVVVLRCAVS